MSITRTTGLALVLLVASATAAAQTYVGASLGQSSTSFKSGDYALGLPNVAESQDKTDGAGKLFAGYAFNRTWAVEGGYADLGKGKDNADFVSTWAKPRVAQLGVTAKYNFYNNWYVTGHGGYLRSRTTAGVTVGNVSASEKSWNNGWYAGAGVGYDVTKNVSLALNYDNYHVKYGRAGASQSQLNTNIAAYSASVEYRF